LSLALLLAASVLVWKGTTWGLAGAALVALAVVLLSNSRASRWSRPAAANGGNANPEGSETAASGANRREATPLGGTRIGAAVMVEAVVPVWSRQLEVTREAAADGLANLLNAFAEMSGALQTLNDNLGSFTLSAEPGAINQAVKRESPALQALTAASERALAQRDATTARAGECIEGLHRLSALAKRSRELSRHTRMVAFNASIESNRARTQTDGGSQAVATEARMLSTQMAETGELIHREVQSLLQKMVDLHRQSEVQDTTAEELRLEIDLQARQALAALLASLGGALQNSTEVHQAAQTLKEQLDAAFVNFQFGDRVSQMLAIVGNDMSNFAQWVAANPRATQSDAADWLLSLDASYTMEEQRSTHHGNVHVQQSSGVEFF
jgi:methyl-accepting chemotaxis protein